VPSGAGEAGRSGAPQQVPLRQSCLRVAKRAAIMVGRYTHGPPVQARLARLKFLRYSTSAARSPRTMRSRSASPTCLPWPFGCVFKTGAFSRSSAAWPQGLCAARARGGVHRQGQSVNPLRIRLQGIGRDAGDKAQGRPVCAPLGIALLRLFRIVAPQWSFDTGNRCTEGQSLAWGDLARGNV
jgi:hypothetical protein